MTAAILMQWQENGRLKAQVISAEVALALETIYKFNRFEVEFSSLDPALQLEAEIVLNGSLER